MKEKIANMIQKFVKEYEQETDISTNWGEPLVGFASANHPYILKLKELITPTHGLPTDVLSDASIVIAYFVPFTKELADTNRISRDIASTEWALAYEETNALIFDSDLLNISVIEPNEKLLLLFEKNAEEILELFNDNTYANMITEILLEEIKKCKNIAEKYLNDRNISIDEITYILGFSETSAFHRAFKN